MEWGGGGRRGEEVDVWEEGEGSLGALAEMKFDNVKQTHWPVETTTF